MNYLSICTIFSHEEPYIGDWLKYHLGLGVEHFYLYNNGSPDASEEIARDVCKSRATFHFVPGVARQRSAHEDMLKSHGDESRWVAFIDVDEYIVPHSDLYTLLKAYEEHPALCPHWYLFGSNGHLRYEPVPVVERFPRRQKEVNPHVKSIVDPKRTARWVTAHKFVHTAGYAVDENHREIADLDSTPAGGTCDVIQINHYATKSYDECMERRARARADIGTIRYDLAEFWAGHDRNDVEDLEALKIWQKLSQS